jgi:hypothetical protein
MRETTHLHGLLSRISAPPRDRKVLSGGHYTDLSLHLVPPPISLLFYVVEMPHKYIMLICHNTDLVFVWHFKDVKQQ